MGGFFGTVSMQPCSADLFYGTDYQSHMGTKRGGMATLSEEGEFFRSIHNLESTYFRTRFEDELDKFKGNAGIGVISDTDAQPMLMNSHLGRFALVTVAKINNLVFILGYGLWFVVSANIKNRPHSYRINTH